MGYLAGEIGFVGLGVMGAPMAGHLLDAHGRVTVWNRTASKATQLEARGARLASGLSELGAGCDVVFLCVGRTEDVRECLESLTHAARPGTLFVDHSTIDPGATEGIHRELRGRGFRFVDAPVTGGSMGAQKGQLTVFCGGEEADVAEAVAAIQPYAKRAERVGGPGAGQRMKMANQIAVGGALLGLCEALAFARKAGLDESQARELISGGAGGSWAFEHYGPKILGRDWSPGFSIVHQRKDFEYCRRSAKEIDAAIPATDLVDRLLARLEERGLGDWTTAALYEIYMEMTAEA
jgi:3-hydroxyisobutyrate dehydrogenase